MKIISILLSQSIFYVYTYRIYDPLANKKTEFDLMCDGCRFFEKTFMRGVRDLKQLDFSTGHNNLDLNSDKRDSKFTESKLATILEYICVRSEVAKEEDAEWFEPMFKNKTIVHRCMALGEKYEKDIENWYYAQQNDDTDLFTYLCIDKAKQCCPPRTFGPKCNECPSNEAGICSGHGVCQGSGLRTGTGECQCSPGYTGDKCSVCAPTFYERQRDGDSVICSPCHSSCKDGICTKEGAAGCNECNNGYEWKMNDDERYCADINECLDTNICNEMPNSHCFNFPGKYSCECDDGYWKRQDECVPEMDREEL